LEWSWVYVHPILAARLNETTFPTGYFPHHGAWMGLPQV
jgi:hypothetical protein